MLSPSKKNSFNNLKELRNIVTWRIRYKRRALSVWLIICSILIAFFILFSLLTKGENQYGQFWTDFSLEEIENSDRRGFNDKSDNVLSEQVISSKLDSPFQFGCREPDVNAPRANAAFVVLARNSEIEGVISSMKSMERHFNQWFNYPWVFLNNEPFDEMFKETVKLYTSSEIEFGEIPQTRWDFSDQVDPLEFAESINSQGDRGIMYGNLPSYHKMCRFYSGPFYKHDLVKKRDWYWRVEPNVEFYCDLTYDPFIEMEKKGKKYGFTVTISELYYTIPGLFKETRSFIQKNGLRPGTAWNLFVTNSRHAVGKDHQSYDGLRNKKEILQELEDNITVKKFLQLKKTDEQIKEFDEKSGLITKLIRKSNQRPQLYEDRMEGEDYNLCHFWSNFEIARTDLFTSEVYEAYFNHLDASGGFYRERWGDAPIHSLAVGLMLDLKDIHYFRDIGYRHSTLGHCPGNSPTGQMKYGESELYSRTKHGIKEDRYWLAPDKPVKAGVGCRCRCPKNHREIENSGGSCIKEWSELTSDNFKAFEKVDLDEWEPRLEKMIDSFIDTGGDLGTNQIVERILS